MPHPIIAAYIAELNENRIVSTSHMTLASLWDIHGRDVVQNLLHDYFTNLRIWSDAK